MKRTDHPAATFRPPYRYEPSRHGPVTIYDAVDVGWIARVKESLPHKEALARAMVDGLNAASAGTAGISEVCYVCGALQIVCRCPGGPTDPPSDKCGAATSRVEPGADSVQLNPESAPASSAASRDSMIGAYRREVATQTERANALEETLAGLVWVAKRNGLGDDPYVHRAEAILSPSSCDTSTALASRSAEGGEAMKVIARYGMHHSPYEEEFDTLDEAFSFLAHGQFDSGTLSAESVTAGETVYRRGEPEFERRLQEASERTA